jgi:RNA polymerase sigma-70 factor (ECF subfamily)
VAGDELPPELRAKAGASDLVQQTFLEAHQAFPGFRGTTEEELRAWLRRILRHNLANFIRDFRNTDKRRVAREDPAATVGLPAADLSPGSQAVAREEAEALERALARLPEEYRQAILLRQQEGLSFAALATRLGRTEEAARKLWSRGVERLRQELQPPDERPS